MFCQFLLYSVPLLEARCLRLSRYYVILTSISSSNSHPRVVLFPGKFRAKTVYDWAEVTQETIFFFFFFFGLFRATPMTYGSFQARGRIGATAAGLCHSLSNTRSKLHLWPTEAHSNSGSFNPLSKARNQTHIFTDTSETLNALSHNGNSKETKFKACICIGWFE